MVKTLTRHGNSLALVIDKPILELLKIDEKTPLQIHTDGHGLYVGPVQSQELEGKFQRALDDTNRKYGRMLKRLSE